jgi:peptidyl-prolyl cis-trans isomerase NIMA-interacting 1
VTYPARPLAPIALLLLSVAAAPLAAACGSTAPAPHPPEATTTSSVAPPSPATAAPATASPVASAAVPSTDAPKGGSDGGPASGIGSAKPRPPKVGARHVLIQWMNAERASPAVVRTRDQARKVAEEVLRRARAGEDFARLAVEYSDEPNAAARGGSLGVFTRGQMVKQFDDVVFALAVGQISDVVETSFGYHVIQRTE